MAKPSLPSSFSETAEHSTQIKQRINAKLKYVHSDEKRPTDTLRTKADPTKFPLINAAKNRNVSFSRTGRVVRDESDRKPQSGLSVFTILKYDHTKQESSLACLGLQSGTSGRSALPPHSLRNGQDDLRCRADPDVTRGGDANVDRPATPALQQSGSSTENAAGESRVINSAVRRFRTFIVNETAGRAREKYGDELRSDARHEFAMTPSTRSELGSQLSSRKTGRGKGSWSDQAPRDYDADDRLGYSPSEGTNASAKTDPVSRERDGYFTPYRCSVRSDKSAEETYPKSRRLAERKQAAGRKSSSRIDIGRLNKLKNDLAQNSVKEAPRELELPSVFDSHGNLVDQTGGLLGLENELSRSKTQQSDWFGHRMRASRHRATRGEGTGAAVQERAGYQWKADLSQPISFIQPARNAPLTGGYGSLRTKYRLLKPDVEAASGERRGLQHKAAILRRLKGIFRKKGNHYGVPSDMSNVQLAPTNQTGELSRMRGGKVQRGTFLTRHSKWVNNFQSLQEEGLASDAEVDFLVTRSTCRPADQASGGRSADRGPSSLRSVELTTPIDRELMFSRAARRSDRGVYELRMGEKSVLIIDHPRDRAAREARIRPQIEAAFGGQQEVAFSSDDLTTNSSMWVPPNTPHYDVTGRPLAHDDDTFAPSDDAEKLLQAVDGSVYSEH